MVPAAAVVVPAAAVVVPAAYIYIYIYTVNCSNAFTPLPSTPFRSSHIIYLTHLAFCHHRMHSTSSRLRKLCRHPHRTVSSDLSHRKFAVLYITGAVCDCRLPSVRLRNNPTILNESQTHSCPDARPRHLHSPSNTLPLNLMSSSLLE